MKSEKPLDPKRFGRMLDGLGKAIADGIVTPEPGELEALLVVALQHGFEDHANLVRAWLGPAYVLGPAALAGRAAR